VVKEILKNRRNVGGGLASWRGPRWNTDVKAKLAEMLPCGKFKPWFEKQPTSKVHKKGREPIKSGLA
jgi:hypothetical protein